MPIYELTPRKIVSELNKYIIGQDAAKRSVAIAIRNRWRRQQIKDEMREEVLPKNIIMIGPTGVGKTEIARRLATLVKAPFLKVEATKYTEIGYYGRNVDSMIRDLVEISVNMSKQEAFKEIEEKARLQAEEKLLDMLLPASARSKTSTPPERPNGSGRAGEPPEPTETKTTREKFRDKLRNGQLEQKTVEIKIEESAMPIMQVFSSAGIEEYGMDIQNMLGSMLPTKQVPKKVTVEQARKILIQQEAEKLIDKEKVIKEAISNTENSGIIFVDEIDKIVAREHSHGPDVSREGVQRDLLPIVEGSSIPTRYGIIRTNHVLFIAAGAFTISKPSDLIPELQGRFPIRVELTSLGKDDFVRILTEPQNALIKQYQSLIQTEGITLKFNKESIEEIAQIAAEVNSTMQNIGARRLHTIVEKVLEDILFEAPDTKEKMITIDRPYVRHKLTDILASEDIKKYIL